MNVVQNSCNAPVSFKAKFMYSDDLQKVVDYAIVSGKYKKLDKARLNIETSMLKTRLRMDIDTYNGMPKVIFSRFDPRLPVGIPKDINKDYTLRKQVAFLSVYEKNPIKFAYNLIVKMGKNVPENDLFRYAVSGKPTKFSYLYTVT